MENGKLTYSELETKWGELYHKRRNLQNEIDRINAEMEKILCEIDNLPLDKSDNS